MRDAPYQDENGGGDGELLQRGGRDEPHYYDPLNECLEENNILLGWIYRLNINTKVKYRHIYIYIYLSSIFHKD